MIETLLIKYLQLNTGLFVSNEVPGSPKPQEYIIVQRTASGRSDLINSATYAIQSYSRRSKFRAAQLNELVKLLDSGKIRNNLAKSTLEKMLDTGKSAADFISESDMGGLDDNALLELCKNAVEGNPKAVEDYKNGKEKAIKALVGNVMKNSRGKADAVAAEAKIKDIINNA